MSGTNQEVGGGKQVYEGDATRTESKFRYDLIPAAGVEGAARRFAYGAKKHGEWNWVRGGEAFRLATISHLLGDVFDYLRHGNRRDMNTDAMVCNAMMLSHFEWEKEFEGVPADAGLAAGVEGQAAEAVADQVSARDTEMKRAAESGFFRTEDQMFFRELRTKAIITNMLLQGWDRRKAEERVSHYSQADLLQYEAMSAPVLDVVERYIAKVEAKNGGGIQGSGSVQADVGRRP